MEKTKNERNIKIILVGGETKDRFDFSDKWAKNIYSDEKKSYINSQLSTKEVEIEGVKFIVNLWVYYSTDLNFTLTKIFTNNSLGVVYLTEEDDEKSMNNIRMIKRHIDENCRFEDGSALPSILIKTKNGIESKLKKFALQNKIDSVFKVSIKEGVNVNESMDYLLNIINKRMKESIGWDNYFNKPERNNIILKSKKKTQKEKGC